MSNVNNDRFRTEPFKYFMHTYCIVICVKNLYESRLSEVEEIKWKPTMNIRGTKEPAGIHVTNLCALLLDY